MIKLLYACAISFIAFAGFFLSDERIHKGYDGDIIEIVFGEARNIISGFAMLKADMYYHGGVGHQHDDDHHDEHEHGEEHADEHAHSDEHEHADKHEHADSSEKAACNKKHGHQKHYYTEDSLFRDWWAWANSEIHPHKPKHLQPDKDEKEVLPWMWIALKSDPHNVEAWNTSSYWIQRVKGVEDALEMISEGIRYNPEAPKLLYTRAEIRIKLEQHAKAEQDLRTALMLLEKSSKAGTLDEDGLWLHRNCLQWLTSVNEMQKDYKEMAYFFQRRINHPLLKGKEDTKNKLQERLNDLKRQQPQCFND